MKKILALLCSALFLCSCAREESPSHEVEEASEAPPSVSSSSQAADVSSSQGPSITLALMDSNGSILANEEVIVYGGSSSVTGRTDSNGKVRLTLPPQSESVYQMDLPSFDSSLLYVTPGAPLGLMLFDVSQALETGEEVAYVLRVYPILQQTPSANCIVLTLCDRNGEPLANQHIFYSTDMAGTENIVPTTPVLGLGLEAYLGLTDTEGKVVLHDPSKIGEYRFYYAHPEDGYQRKVYAAVTLESLEGVQEFSFCAPEYPLSEN